MPSNQKFRSSLFKGLRSPEAEPLVGGSEGVRVSGGHLDRRSKRPDRADRQDPKPSNTARLFEDKDTVGGHGEGLTVQFDGGIVGRSAGHLIGCVVG